MLTSGCNWQRSQLGYCSNVHAGATLAQMERVVGHHMRNVRQLRNLAQMDAGLWLGARVARELRSAPQKLLDFTRLLAENGVSLRTLNGFPFDDFHGSRVKESVYLPHWADPERLAYTLDLAHILTAALPAGETEGTISTLPLGFMPAWNRERQQQALAALCQLAVALDELAQKSGRRVRVCLEMEPGCVLESTSQIVRLFSDELTAAARKWGTSRQQLSEYLGVCYDVCHQAVMFERPSDSLADLESADVPIGKFQISSALELSQPTPRNARQLLHSFTEERYLHQVRTIDAAGKLRGVMDLPQALSNAALPFGQPWRIHFHLPIQLATLAGQTLTTTQQAILDVLDYLRNRPKLRPHLEVETYTWQVLPDALRPTDDRALQQGIARELEWLEDEMHKRGLLQQDTA